MSGKAGYLIFVLALAVSTQLQAGERYFGLRFGAVKGEFSDNHPALSSESFSAGGIAPSLFLGTMLSDKWGTEVSYTHVDKVIDDAFIGQKSDILSLDLFYKHRLSDRWTLRPRVGIAHWRSTITAPIRGYYYNRFDSNVPVSGDGQLSTVMTRADISPSLVLTTSDGGYYGAIQPQSPFELMPLATFATFESFYGPERAPFVIQDSNSKSGFTPKLGLEAAYQFDKNSEFRIQWEYYRRLGNAVSIVDSYRLAIGDLIGALTEAGPAKTDVHLFSIGFAVCF